MIPMHGINTNDSWASLATYIRGTPFLVGEVYHQYENVAAGLDNNIRSGLNTYCSYDMTAIDAQWYRGVFF